MSDLADLCTYLDGSPSPFHAVAGAAARLDAAGFAEVAEAADWSGASRGYVRRGGALIAWSTAPTGVPTVPAAFHVVGAHTDSPGLRVKPHPDVGALGWRQLGVEIYGGVLLNSWLDRDLGVAGRIVTVDGHEVLVDVRRPIARVPQLAIHLDREINERGLQLDKQQHLTPVWGVGPVERGAFAEFLAAEAGLEPTDLAAWDLALYDLTPAAVLGADEALLASGRLDNQLSCWAATTALAAAVPRPGTAALIALFDHEEVGSASEAGASGPVLERVLERLVLAAGGTREHYLKSLAASSCVSADNAHAVHPNYPERHEPEHRPMVNRGPAVKLNANQRYATSAVTAALFQRCCEQAGVPYQRFVSRNNMPCGSTIGPLTATRLGIATVDVGVPQLSMHSARELCGTEDPAHLAAALTTYLGGA